MSVTNSCEGKLRRNRLKICQLRLWGFDFPRPYHLRYKGMFMPLAPNRKSEDFFLRLLENGTLVLFKSGKVLNTTTNRYIGYLNSKGYVALGIKNNFGKVQHILVHRLLWLYCIGPIPDGIFINHKDGSKTNNKLSNLELVTNAENIQHAVRIGLSVVTESRRKAQSLRQRGEKSSSCLLYTSPSPRDGLLSRMPSSA